jgi:hypothetical protein
MLLTFIMLTLREVPTGIFWGLFFAISAILMATQTIKSYRKRFMYCGRTERVYRDKNPVKFKIWCVIQTFFVVFLISFSLYAFLA